MHMAESQFSLQEGSGKKKKKSFVLATKKNKASNGLVKSFYKHFRNESEAK